MSESKTEQISNTLGKLMGFISSESSEAKHVKGMLRHAQGQSPGDNPELWGWLLSNIPDEIQGKDGNVSYGEYAIYVTLVLCSIGPSQNNLLTIAESTALSEIARRRLAMAETADTITKCQTELIYLNRMLAQKGSGYNYFKLAEDLYQWQFNKTEVARKWEREYARKEIKK